MSEREPIAVVGLDCRFPGARDAREFWSLLMDGRDGTGPVPAGRWDADRHRTTVADGGTPGRPAPGRTNTTRGGFIDDPDAFDPDFFGIAPAEAEAMDPQQRLLLQCAWRAVEDAAIAPQDLAGTDTGVFVGVMANEWAFLQLADYDRITARHGSGNGYFMGANRVSYHLDLRGPSLAVDTACSSSLVAVHLAVNALRSGECDHALAAGTNLIMTPVINIFYAQAGLSAPDGRCKPFSADADGIGRAEGVAVLVLRRLRDALADRQPVYAVLAESGSNQDGRSNGITAPSRWAQRRLIESVWRRAGVTADDIAFVEAHGTGTLLGDHMEAQALGELTAGRGSGSVALGSVKSNLGHAEGAAGVAGLVKAVLALHHRTVPPSRFAQRENPKLDLAGRRLALLRAPLRLPPGPVHAAVSSFGMGGTNAHAVLAGAPRTARRGTPGAPGVFTVSARTPERLRANLLAQAAGLARRPADQLAQLCWTSNRVKSRLPYRAAVAADGLSALAEGLRAAAGRAEERADRDSGHRAAPSVAFAFTGQGAQHPRMAASWYGSCPAYARHLDGIDEMLAPYTGRSVRGLVLDGDAEVHRARFAQPALFAVGYAMAATLAEAGIRPSAVLGHSIGEFAAAVVAGALDPADAARLVARRGALMEALPEDGGMLATGLDAAAAEALLAGRPRLSVAADNGPRNTVISGDLSELDALADELRGRKVGARRLGVSHAFHSPLMRPMVAEFRAECAEVTVRRPVLPVFSTVYGRALDDEESLDAAYWARQITAPVRFAGAAEALLGGGVTHVVELGPRAVLTPLLARLAADGGHPARAHAAHPGEHAPAYRPQQLLGELWCDGLAPEWDVLYADADRVPRRLPPYVFDDTFRSWRSGDAPARPAPGASATATATPPTETEWAERAGRAGRAGRAEPSAAAPAALAEPDAADGAARSPDELAAVTRRLVCRVGGHAPDRVHDRSRLHEDLGFDSIRVMELKARIEHELPRLGSLPVEELLASLRTVGDLVGYLRGRHPVPEGTR